MAFGILAKDQVLERWGTLISGAQNMGDGMMDSIEHLIEQTKVPDAKVQRRAMAPGLIRGVLGGKRPFLVISNSSNPNLKPLKMYLNARDYGINLQVSWFVVHQPSFIQKIIGFLLCVPVLGVLLLPAYSLSRIGTAKQAGILGLDLFDEQDLRAYITNAHHCMLEAVDNLGKEQNIDTSDICRRSDGFLGIQ